MTFLKENWAKLLVSLVTLASAIIILVSLIKVITTDGYTFNFVGASQSLGLLLFFVGITAYYITKIFIDNKKVAGIILIATGALTLLFLIIGAFGFDKEDPQGVFGALYALPTKLANFATGVSGLAVAVAPAVAGIPALAGAVAGLATAASAILANVALLNAAATAVLLIYVTLILTFGLVPVIKGVHKLLSK